MGTKLNPGKNDCYDKAMPDEPRFTLLARDPMFYTLIETWAKQRHRMIMCGERPDSDNALIDEAMDTAMAGARWRRRNNGAWRKKDEPTPPVPPVPPAVTPTE